MISKLELLKSLIFLVMIPVICPLATAEKFCTASETLLQFFLIVKILGSMSNTPQSLGQHLLMWLNHCNIIVTHTDTVYIITSAKIRTIFRTTKFSDKKNDRTIYPHSNYPSSVGNSFTLFPLFQRSLSLCLYCKGDL